MGEITNFRGEATDDAPRDFLEGEVQALLQRVGARVRKARELKGMPRRVVCEKSGVSPRYLAQLEMGEGNISIGLLQRIAVALDHRIEWLVGDDDPWTSEAIQIADLYRSATAEQRRQAMEALGDQSNNQRRAQRICLIGLRGAGKSTLGAMVSQVLKVPFVELNVDIEEHAGMPVSEVVALYGPEGYRTLEAQALKRIIATHDSVILAAAGGVVVEPETFKTLLTHFHTVWIKASPEEHMQRVLNQGDTRPMADNPGAMDQLRSMLASREALYERAQAQLDTSGKPLQASVEELAALIGNADFLEDKLPAGGSGKQRRASL